MKHYRIFIAITMLVLATLACQAVTGGGSEGENNVPPGENSVVEETQAAPATTAPSGNSGSGGTDSGGEGTFPITDDAFNIVDAGDGTLIYYTRLSAEEAMDFYREEFTSKGFTERDILTVVADGTFSMVFDGDPSGEAVVIQSVDLGDGSRTIAIRFEDV